MPLAVTRPVPAAIAHCELTHLDRTPIDVEVARREHAAYERALERLGYRVQRLAAADDQPDSVFIEDTAVVVDEIAVITRPGAESRQEETGAVAAALRPLRPVAELSAPATLDGGDVLRLGRVLYVGTGARSNAEGAAQLRALLDPFGYEVREAAFTGCLHLKTAVTAVGDGLVLANPEWVEARQFEGARAVEVDPSEPFAANALLARGAVIHADAFPRTRRRLEAAGVRVVPVPAGELAKAEGGVTCCCLLLS